MKQIKSTFVPPVTPYFKVGDMYEKIKLKIPTIEKYMPYTAKGQPPPRDYLYIGKILAN